MTHMLHEALKRLEELPPERQDAVASRLLDDLADDRRWDERLDETSDQVDDLADAVLKRHAEGKTIERDWDDL